MWVFERFVKLARRDWPKIFCRYYHLLYQEHSIYFHVSLAFLVICGYVFSHHHTCHTSLFYWGPSYLPIQLVHLQLYINAIGRCSLFGNVNVSEGGATCIITWCYGAVGILLSILIMIILLFVLLVHVQSFCL